MTKSKAQTPLLDLIVSKAINFSIYKIGILHFLGFLFIVCLQTTHFFFYMKFSIEYALLWALLDWSIWFLLFLTVFYNKKIGNTFKKLAIRRIHLVIGITILFPFLHTFIAFLIYSTFSEIEGGYFENLIGFIAKRWFQNIFISAVLTIVFDFVKRTLQSKSEKKAGPLHDSAQIIFKDGSDVYQLSPEEIKWISSAKNYVVIETTEKQLLIRMTLNAIFEKIKIYGFIKISRSMIVNKNLIQMIKKKSQYSQLLVTKTGHNFPIGRTYLKSVIEFMTN